MFWPYVKFGPRLFELAYLRIFDPLKCNENILFTHQKLSPTFPLVLKINF